MSGKVVGWAMEQKTGQASAKSVLVKLADNANEDGECWPRIKLICQHTELSERTVQKALGHLQALGLVTVEERTTARGQTSNLYRLAVPKRGEFADHARSARPRGLSPGSAAPPAANTGVGGVTIAGDARKACGGPPQNVRGPNKDTNPHREPSLNAGSPVPPAPEGRVGRLANELGARFEPFFGDAEFLEGSPARIVFSTRFKRSYVETAFGNQLRDIFGDDLVLGCAVAGKGP